MECMECKMAGATAGVLKCSYFSKWCFLKVWDCVYEMLINFQTRPQTDRLPERFEVRTSTFGIHSVSYQCIMTWYYPKF